MTATPATVSPPEATARPPWLGAWWVALVVLAPLQTVSLQWGISWKPYFVPLAVLLAAEARVLVMNRRLDARRLHVVAALAFLAAPLVGLPLAARLGRFLSLYVALVLGVAVCFLASIYLRQPGLLARTLRAIRWSGLAMAATGIAIYLSALDVPGFRVLGDVAWVPGVWRGYEVAYSGYVTALTNWHHDPGFASEWMTMWVLLWLVAAVLPETALARRRWLDPLGLGALGCCVILTFNRTAWLLLLPAVAVTVALAGRALRVFGAILRTAGTALVAGTAAFLLVLGAGALGGTDAGQESTSFRIGQFRNMIANVPGLDALEVELPAAADPGKPEEAGEIRAALWDDYWGYFTSRPVTGIGLGSGWETNRFGLEPHQLWLELLGEMGLLGFGAFVFASGTLVVGASRRLGAADRATRVLAVLGLAAFAHQLLHFQTATGVFEASLWLALGFCAAACAVPARR